MFKSFTTNWFKLVPWCLVVALWLVLTADLMLGLSVVGYRDSGYLYYPLFEAIDQAWTAGKTPLWNPNCNFGFPTAADGSSSVFYPGKLMFAIPWLPFPARYGCYQSIHLMIAAVGSFLLAKRLGSSLPAAALTALTYTFGGPVIFQATNVIYLVSAAWLPWALREVHTMSSGQNRITAAIKASIYCALMLLGGDPQMVYHVGLIAVVTLTVEAWKQSRADRRLPAPATSKTPRPFSTALCCLLILVVTTSLLSLIQLLPTAELASRSERVPDGRVVNIYSAAEIAWNDPAHPGWMQAAAPLVNRDDLVVGQYQFSQPPWSLVEMVLPNVGGKPFPINRRWINQLPSADRMWFPSLYLGLLGVILAITQFRLWGSNRRAVWISWITTVFLLGSFGWYGGAWLYREIASLIFGSTVEGSPPWAAPVGGVYWWMSILLPRYYSFRYPAKLLVVASLGIAVLAGMGLQRISRQFQSSQESNGPSPQSPESHYSGISLTLGGACIALWLIEWFARPAIERLALADPLFASPFGPLDVNGTVQQIQAAVIQASAVIISLLIWKSISQVRRYDSQTFAVGILAIATLDLGIANSWLLAKVPAATFTQDAAAEIEPAPESMDHLPLVVAPEMPPQFAQSHSNTRLAEWILWQRTAYQPKFHLTQKQRIVGSFHSIWPRNYRRLVDHALAFEGPWHNGLPGPAKGMDIQQCELDWNEAQLQLQCNQPGWHELPLFGDGNWNVVQQSVTGGITPVSTRVSENDLLEVKLAPGQHRLRCEYLPGWLRLGGAISGITWVAAFGFLIVRWRSNRSANHHRPS